ncbi:DUF1917-domain-containing protein [Venustampulla echinocandica]|uniref:DUF1917-domain-containing protein n=1 Tax=Venustampulla echinocandica TaxID=2656787 RepID=A0A370TG00_9HELO|nr:DUF1917-domain-containing protein [Venustampulla echinocandica]RDL33826.1 DUF1917-domain-containing protein [Venustampulla echinocandica]
MAMKGGGHAFKQEDLDAAYLSDESDFYGDETMRQDFEERANNFNPEEWWKHKVPSLMEIAELNIETAKLQQTATLYNYYQGTPGGRQLEETVAEFLRRLPPAATPLSEQLPWIRICNPYRKVPKQAEQRTVGNDLTAEGPPDEESEWARFVVQGQRLLEKLLVVKNEIEERKLRQAKSTITKAANAEKNKIVKEILDTAAKLHCTSGKWMIFCPPEEVNAVWSIVARATAENDLGIAAKVAPDDGNNRKPRLICIYTKDFTDRQDVSRVIHKLKSLGLVDATSNKSIYYKCDAYTYLGLNSANRYGIQASLYDSREFLKPKSNDSKGMKDGKVDGYFYKQKKDEDSWRSVGLE